jgi:xanthine/CO dehydrogenase XdhC/CoxF family maturation factor
MLITQNGWQAGSISGGCLESDLVQTAWPRISEGPTLVTYDSTADDDIVWGFGLGCNGVVQVLLEALPASGGVLRYLADCLDRRERALVATVLTQGCELGSHFLPIDEAETDFQRALCLAFSRIENGEIEQRGGCARVSICERDVMLEKIEPPCSLTIFGAGHDAIPLVRLAKEIGWHVTIVDGRSSHATTERFPVADRIVLSNPRDVCERVSIEPGSAAVLMTHNYLNDLEILRFLSDREAAYIGVLGPKVRTDRLLADLSHESLPPRFVEAIHAPVGLDLGAVGPDEIALSTLAEILRTLNQRTGRSLRELSEPLHPSPVGLAPSSA